MISNLVKELTILNELFVRESMFIDSIYESKVFSEPKSSLNLFQDRLSYQLYLERAIKEEANLNAPISNHCLYKADIPIKKYSNFSTDDLSNGTEKAKKLTFSTYNDKPVLQVSSKNSFSTNNFDFQAGKKRLKALFFNYLFNQMNYLLKDVKNGAFISKLPSNYYTNLNYKFNRDIFIQTIEQLFTSFPTISQEEKRRLDHNNKIMNKDDLPAEFMILKSKKLFEVYNDFLESYEFQDALDRLKSLKGNDYSRFILNIAKIYISKLKIE